MKMYYQMYRLHCCNFMVMKQNLSAADGGIVYIKAFRVKPDVSVSEMVAPYFSASGYLLDSYRKGVPGGTGEKFDWQLVPDNLDKPVILAGGLEPGNVAEAIRQVRPYAVDVRQWC